SSPMGKSFRQAADENDTMAKAIEVSEFIEAMVDQTSASLAALAESVAGVRGHVDDRIAKSAAVQSNFNRRVAHAITMIGNTQNEMLELLKSLGNQPAPAKAGKALLSKSEVAVPPFAGGGNGLGGQVDEDGLTEIPVEKINDWLFEKACAGQIPALQVS